MRLYALVNCNAATYPKPNKTDLVKPIFKELDIENLQTIAEAGKFIPLNEEDYGKTKSALESIS